MLRHVVYKRNEKDFATRVVEDDATGAVTQYIGDAVAVTATTNLTGEIEKLTASDVDILIISDQPPDDGDGRRVGTIYFKTQG